MQTIVLLVASVASHVMAPAPLAAPEGRVLRHSGVVHASAAELWTAFTTAEGWTGAIGVAKAEIDLRPGGAIRTVYDPAATLGDDSTITNTILAYEPERLLALKPTAPKNAGEHIKAFCETGWSVIRFEPLTPERTRLTVTSMGFQDTELHRKAYDFFDKGNAWTLKKVQEHFATDDDEADTSKARALLARLVGDWSFSKAAPDGSSFGGATHGRLLFEGQLVVVDGFLTIGGKTFQHSHFMAGLHPETGTLRAWSFNEQGDVTEGEVRLDGPERLVVDWNTHQLGDRRFVDYRVEYNFHGPDEYQCRVLYSPEADGTRRELVDVTYKKDAPKPPAR
jgi:uncharacterized protein YndB with AHSA1/START domain